MLRIAEAYANAPVLPNGRTERTIAQELWQAFGAWCIAVTERARRSGLVVPTAEPEPYVDAHAQDVDILGGRYLVSTANCDHPVWTQEQNVAFRTLHDLHGHHGGGFGFDPDGERRAFLHTLPITPTHLRPVLFCESIAQLDFCVANGGFGEQKAILTYGG